MGTVRPISRPKFVVLTPVRARAKSKPDFPILYVITLDKVYERMEEPLFELKARIGLRKLIGCPKAIALGPA